MKLDKLIEKLQQIAAEHGGNIKVRVRNYNGCFGSLTKVDLKSTNKAIWLEASLH